MRKILPYVVTLVVFLILDAAWVTFTAHFYRAALGDAALNGARFLPAIVFYLLQTLGIQIFVIPRAQAALTALAFGAAFGIFTYATYDLTNWATLKDWTGGLSLMDTGWGAVVTALASLAGYQTRRALRLNR